MSCSESINSAVASSSLKIIGTTNLLPECEDPGCKPHAASRPTSPSPGGRDIGASSADRALCQFIHGCHRSTIWYGNTSVTQGAATWKEVVHHCSVQPSPLWHARPTRDNLCARSDEKSEAGSNRNSSKGLGRTDASQSRVHAGRQRDTGAKSAEGLRQWKDFH